MRVESSSTSTSKSRWTAMMATLPLMGGVLMAVQYAPLVVRAQVPQASVGKGTANTTMSCSWSNACPASAPCCSEFGSCGAGSACLGGCNPQFSTNSSYCAPLPVCQSSNYTFTDDSRIQATLSDWDGDASKYDWVVDKLDGSNPALIQNGELVLTLTESGGGTRLSSTREVLYGTITASIKTVGAPGVVTAWITMSGVKDEIDWEWTGNNTDEAQNNYYWEGDVADYSHGGTATAQNRHEQYHVYGFTWTQSQLSWTIDGRNVRTVKASDTVDGGLTKFPQTPSRVQMSVWPAGVAGTSQGTIDWSGGLIDWKSAEYQANGGAYKAHVQWINVECGDSSNLGVVSGDGSGNSSSNSTRLAKREDEQNGRLWERWLAERAPTLSSYVYGTNNSAGQIQVSGSDRDTIINSPYSTGLNMMIKGKDTKGVTTGGLNGSASLPKTAAGRWWADLGTPAKVGICIGAVAVVLLTIVLCCTCWARRKNAGRGGGLGAKQAAYKQVNDDSNAAIPLTATGGSRKPGQAGAAAGRRPPALQPQYSSSSLASSKQQYNDGGSLRNEWTQQGAWDRGRQHHHISREDVYDNGLQQQYYGHGQVPQLGYDYAAPQYQAQQPQWTPVEADLGRQGWTQQQQQQSYGQRR